MRVAAPPILKEAGGIHPSILPPGAWPGQVPTGRLEKVTLTRREIFERYVYAGFRTRDGRIAVLRDYFTP